MKGISSAQERRQPFQVPQRQTIRGLEAEDTARLCPDDAPAAATRARSAPKLFSQSAESRNASI